MLSPPNRLCRQDTRNGRAIQRCTWELEHLALYFSTYRRAIVWQRPFPGGARGGTSGDVLEMRQYQSYGALALQCPFLHVEEARGMAADGRDARLTLYGHETASTKPSVFACYLKEKPNT
jgi:hypothetical protein